MRAILSRDGLKAVPYNRITRDGLNAVPYNRITPDGLNAVPYTDARAKNCRGWKN